MASYKVEICLKKKNPPRAQIFRYFRIESRNNNWRLAFKSSFYGISSLDWKPQFVIEKRHISSSQVLRPKL